MAVQPQVRELQLQRGELILQEGEVLTQLQVVKLGTVYRTRRGRDGEDRPVGLAGRGTVFGSLGYFGHSNQTSVQAMTSVRLCAMELAALRPYIVAYPQIHTALLGELTRTLATVAAWSEGMRVRGVVNQLAYALLLIAEHEGSTTVELPTQQILAHLLGTSRETVVRTLSILQVEGLLVRLDHRLYRICPAGLQGKLNSSPPVEALV